MHQFDSGTPAEDNTNLTQLSELILSYPGFMVIAEYFGLNLKLFIKLTKTKPFTHPKLASPSTPTPAYLSTRKLAKGEMKFSIAIDLKYWMISISHRN